MGTLPPLTDEERENLIAYLDGELDEKTARAFEAKLNRDPRYRAEADTLSRTWSLLDYLPQTEPSTAFGTRTLESVSAFRPATRARKASWHRQPWVLGTGWAAAVVVAAVLGFTGVARWTRWAHPAPPSMELDPADADEQLARDLRVIENQRLYEKVDDLDFLRKLADPDLFGDGS